MKSMRFLSCLLISLLLMNISSCEDTATQEEVLPALEAYSAKKQVTAFEVVTITVKNAALTKSHYQAKFGELDIMMGRGNDTLLVAMVPNVASGNFTLQANIEGKHLGVDYSVTAAPVVADPKSYLEALVQSSDLSLLYASLDAQVSAGTKTRQEADALVNNLQANQVVTLQKLQAATPEELKEAAAFIAANRPLFDEISTALTELQAEGIAPGGRLSTDTATKAKIRKLTFALAKIGAMVAGPALVFVELGALVPGGVVGMKLWASAGAAVGLAIFHKWIAEQMQIAVQTAVDIFDDPLIAVENSLQSEFQRRAEGIFFKDVPRTVDLSIKKRNLQPSDINSSVSLYSNFVLAYTKLSEIWSQFLPELGSLPNMLPRKEQTVQPELANLSLTVTNNAAVTGVLNHEEGVFKVVFTTAQTTEQYFTALFTYTAEDADPIIREEYALLRILTCGEGISTGPVITGVTYGCGSSYNSIDILISFNADGPGIIPRDGSGGCNMSDTCYPVRLLFRNPGATDFSIASNGYDVALVSGTVNEGVVAIQIKGCIAGYSPRQSLDQFYPGYEWKVQLINECNQRSAEVSI